MNPPRVFISYSHDSADHKRWVLDFATTLVNRGVDAVLDQWDLGPGDDLPEFMEQNLASADFAIMVCTKKYVKKANAGEGGVGYEKMIMTAGSLSKISDSKVIPIVREKTDQPVPTFLASKLYIDFNDDDDLEFALDELLRKLLNTPLFKKPEIGSSPFEPLKDSRPDRTVDGLKNVMEDIAAAFDHTSLSFISKYNLIKKSKMRRLTLDKYVGIALQKKLIRVNEGKYIYLTDSGRSYLSEHGIIEA